MSIRARPSSRVPIGLRAGTLNNKASLQRRGAGKDEYGQPLETWAEYASVWCNAKLVSGLEHAESGTQVGIGRGSIRIRYRADVTTQDRAVVQGIIYNIAAVLPDVASREYTDLVVTVGANLG
jgi:SPP1 family predicted phage head-tail adaptor